MEESSFSKESLEVQTNRRQKIIFMNRDKRRDIITHDLASPEVRARMIYYIQHDKIDMIPVNLY